LFVAILIAGSLLSGRRLARATTSSPAAADDVDDPKLAK
jgi:hypothetical protein